MMAKVPHRLSRRPMETVVLPPRSSRVMRMFGTARRWEILVALFVFLGMAATIAWTVFETCCG